MSSFEQLTQWANQECLYESTASDGVTVIQEQLTPKNNQIHRVWFVRDRITAAVTVVRPILAPEGNLFNGGCVGACSVNNRQAS